MMGKVSTGYSEQDCNILNRGLDICCRCAPATCQVGGNECGTGGFCDPPSCSDNEGRCKNIPDMCPATFAPVCGCDRKQYSNDCERMKAKVGAAPASLCSGASTTTTTVQPGGGAISVSSTPSGATISLSSQNKGLTPATISGLSAGKYSVKLTLSGYRDYVKTVTVRNGQTASVAATLKSIPAGTLTVNSVPAGASVTLNGEAKGTTPLTLTNLPVRKYTVQLTLTGYKNFKKVVKVKNGQETTVNARLKPAS